MIMMIQCSWYFAHTLNKNQSVDSSKFEIYKLKVVVDDLDIAIVDKKVFDCVRHIAAIDNLPDSITAQRGELWSFQIYALLYKSRNLENQDVLEKIRMLCQDREG